MVGVEVMVGVPVGSAGVGVEPLEVAVAGGVVGVPVGVSVAVAVPVGVMVGVEVSVMSASSVAFMVGVKT